LQSQLENALSFNSLALLGLCNLRLKVANEWPWAVTLQVQKEHGPDEQLRLPADRVAAGF
jgi:hypothetical protein